MNYRRKIMPALLAGGLILSTAAVALAQVETTTVRTTTVTTDPLILPVGTSYVVVDPATGVTRGIYDPITKKADFALSPGMIVIDNTTNKAVATFDAGGNLIALSSAPIYDPLLVSIDTRRAEFDRVIVDLASKGTYDAATVAALRADLDRINALAVAYRSSGRPLSYSEELALAVQLNTLGDRLVPFARTVAFTPLFGARFVTTDGQLVFVDSYGGRNLQMQRRIDAEYAAGRLSNNQVARLKQDLNEISTLQAKYTKGGKLKDSKQRLITEKLDRVQTAMDKDIATINEKRARIGIKVN